MGEELLMLKEANEQICNFFSVRFDEKAMESLQNINQNEINETKIKIFLSKNVKLYERTLQRIHLTSVKHEYAYVIEKLYQNFMTNDISKRLFFDVKLPSDYIEKQLRIWETACYFRKAKNFNKKQTMYFIYSI